MAVIEAGLRAQELLFAEQPIQPLRVAIQALRRLNAAANSAKHDMERASTRRDGDVVAQRTPALCSLHIQVDAYSNDKAGRYRNTFYA